MTFVLTTGEPSGIGPDIVLQLWHEYPQYFQNNELKVVIDDNLLLTRAKQLNIDYQPGAIQTIHVPLVAPCQPGKLDKRNAPYVMRMLTLAAQGCLDGTFSGMITGPIHKGILNDGDFQIAGHTDFLTRFTKTKRTVMMLMTEQLKVALLTDHVPLRNVPDLLTKDSLSNCLDIILGNAELSLRIKKPRILVCGLNPHAGEDGHIGSEEQQIISPVIQQYQKNGHMITGPVAADIAFTPPMQSKTDITLAMYHDQGLPTLKYAGFHNAINITLGLPFIRTSVDHGTALSLAATGNANYNSLQQAILFARQQALPALS